MESADVLSIKTTLEPDFASLPSSSMKGGISSGLLDVSTVDRQSEFVIPSGAYRTRFEEDRDTILAWPSGRARTWSTNSAPTNPTPTTVTSKGCFPFAMSFLSSGKYYDEVARVVEGEDARRIINPNEYDC